MAPSSTASTTRPRDLVQLQQVGRAAQVERERALGEGAEAALEGADVGVVDVAVAHEGHVVAGDAAAQIVGHLGHHAHLGAAGAEERHDLGLADLLAQRHAGQHLGHRATAGLDEGGRAAPRAGPVEQRGRRRLAARAPRGVAGQALGVGGVQDGEVQRRVEPARRVVGEGRVDGQPGRQGVAGRLGGLAQRCRAPARPARGSRGRP